MKLRLREHTPWEVVHSAEVEPVFMYEDDDDCELSSVSEGDTCGTYVFDVKKGADLRAIVRFARERLLHDLAKKYGFDVLLLSEGYRLTIMRKGKKYRVEVRYSGRPARVMGKPPPLRPPPFMNILDRCRIPPV